MWLGRAWSPGLWWALRAGRLREGRGSRPSPHRQQERPLCGVPGALRVASSPACPPPLLWRHPAPGPDPALGCRLLHSHVPCSRIVHSSEDVHFFLWFERPLGSSSRRLRSKSYSSRRPGEPCGGRMLGSLWSRSCAWFLRLKFQTGSGLLR